MITFKTEKGKVYLESTCKDKREITIEQAEKIIEVLIKHVAKITKETKVYITGDYEKEGDE